MRSVAIFALLLALAFADEATTSIDITTSAAASAGDTTTAAGDTTTAAGDTTTYAGDTTTAAGATTSALAHTATTAAAKQNATLRGDFTLVLGLSAAPTAAELPVALEAVRSVMHAASVEPLRAGRRLLSAQLAVAVRGASFEGNLLGELRAEFARRSLPTPLDLSADAAPPPAAPEVKRREEGRAFPVVLGVTFVLLGVVLLYSVSVGRAREKAWRMEAAAFETVPLFPARNAYA